MGAPSCCRDRILIEYVSEPLPIERSVGGRMCWPTTCRPFSTTSAPSDTRYS